MYTFRVFEQDVVYVSLVREICYLTSFNSFNPFNQFNSANLFNSTNLSNSTSTKPYNNITSEPLPIEVAFWITRVSLYYESLVGAGTFIIVGCCLCRFYKCQQQRRGCLNIDETRMNEIIRAIRPLVIFDCIFVVLMGPIGNVQMFVLKCPEAYVSVVLRIGFYLSALSLPTVYTYLRNRDEEPQLGELKYLVGILVKIALRLVTCSSCLAIFITLNRRPFGTPTSLSLS